VVEWLGCGVAVLGTVVSPWLTKIPRPMRLLMLLLLVAACVASRSLPRLQRVFGSTAREIVCEEQIFPRVPQERHQRHHNHARCAVPIDRSIAAVVTDADGRWPWAPTDNCFAELRATLSKRIMIMDGATGTALQAYKLTEEDYRGT